MKQILADITPVGSNNLFVTHYWPDLSSTYKCNFLGADNKQ